MSIFSLFHAGVIPTLTLNNSGTFTWTKPRNVTNKDAVRDFTVTYYAFLDANGNGKLDAGEMASAVPLGYLNPSTGLIEPAELHVHIGYAEISIQFAGMDDFVERSTSPVQSAINTVVVGQKVYAIVETSEKISLYNTYGVEWTHPSGGNAIRNYTSNSDVGIITELSESYYTTSWNNHHFTDNYVFYYTSIDSFNVYQQGGISATFDLVDDNGKFYYNHTSSASYYIDTPTVTKFTSKFAHEYPYNNKPTIDVRNDKDGDPWLRFGEVDHPSGTLPGIEWQAKVTESQYASGFIAYVQLVNTERKLVSANGTFVISTPADQYYLDSRFPYDIESVYDLLKSNDSPGLKLEDSMTGLSSIMGIADDKFKTWLMYYPTGIDSIWVSLSMMTWEWHAIAEKNNGTWEVWPYPNSGSSVTPRYDTTVLPEWTGNVKNLPWEVI